MAKKIRTTIYIDSGMWEKVRAIAFQSSDFDNRISASKWVENLVKKFFNDNELPLSYDEIEAGLAENERKLHGVSEKEGEKCETENGQTTDGTQASSGEKQKLEDGGQNDADRFLKSTLPGEISEADEALLKKSQENGQKRLDAERKADKIAKVKNNMESLTGFSGPRPKGGK